MDKLNAIYDEDGSGKILICPGCGARAGASSNSKEIPFTHVKLQEDHAAVVSIEPNGDLVTDYGGDYLELGQEYLCCSKCDGYFNFNGKVMLLDVTTSNIEDTFCEEREEYEFGTATAKYTPYHVTETQEDEDPDWPEDSPTYTSYTSHTGTTKTYTDDDIPF